MKREDTPTEEEEELTLHKKDPEILLTSPGTQEILLSHGPFPEVA